MHATLCTPAAVPTSLVSQRAAAAPCSTSSATRCSSLHSALRSERPAVQPPASRRRWVAAAGEKRSANRTQWASLEPPAAAPAQQQEQQQQMDASELVGFQPAWHLRPRRLFLLPFTFHP